MCPSVERTATGPRYSPVVQARKAGTPERLTARSHGMPIATRLSRCAKPTIWWGAEQYSLTTSASASWDCSLSDATCVAKVSADNCGCIGLNVCKLAWRLELPLEWTVYSRWSRFTREVDSC